MSQAGPSAKPPTELEQRVQFGAKLVADYPDFAADASGAVDFYFKEVKASYDAARDRTKVLEAKAGTLIGIVTTGLGAIAILGDPSKIPFGGFWLYAALGAFGLAFVVALLAIVPQPAGYPDLSRYAINTTLDDPDNAPRIKYHLGEQFLSATRNEFRLTLFKGYMVIGSTVLLGIGLALLTANYVVAMQHHTPVAAIHVVIDTPAPAASHEGGASPRSTP